MGVTLDGRAVDILNLETVTTSRNNPTGWKLILNRETSTFAMLDSFRPTMFSRRFGRGFFLLKILQIQASLFRS